MHRIRPLSLSFAPFNRHFFSGCTRGRVPCKFKSIYLHHLKHEHVLARVRTQGFCPPSLLSIETNQAESCQAAGLVGTELLTLVICSLKVSLLLTSTIAPQMYCTTHYSPCVLHTILFSLTRIVISPPSGRSCFRQN